MNTPIDAQLTAHCQRLRLPYLRDHAIEEATAAARKGISHLDFLADLLAGQVTQTETRAIERRIAAARFPTIKTLDTFDWPHPTIDRAHVQSLFQLRFIADPPPTSSSLAAPGSARPTSPPPLPTMPARVVIASRSPAPLASSTTLARPSPATA
jgi:DNA replication protein DnaC